MDLPILREGRYEMPPSLAPRHSQPFPRLRDVLKWQISRPKRRVFTPPAFSKNSSFSLKSWSPTLAFTWIGHSTVLLEVEGKSFLFDPVFSSRIGLFIRRISPPGARLPNLPTPDALLISHNHLDHLDDPTIRALGRSIPVFVPEGVGPWFRKRGFGNVREGTWGTTFKLDDHRITLVPACHWSGRTLSDRNRTLWGGWVVEGPGGIRAYFAGDTGFFPGFQRIAKEFPRIDLAMLPIGAYEPRTIMARNHLSPEEAGEAFLELGAKVLLPIHWGTFILSDEPPDEPPLRLREWASRSGIPSNRIRIPSLGERVELPHPL